MKCSFVCTHNLKAEVRRSFITTNVREQRPRSHHKGATGRVRTGDHGITFYAVANLDKTIYAMNKEGYERASLLGRRGSRLGDFLFRVCIAGNRLLQALIPFDFP